VISVSCLRCLDTRIGPHHKRDEFRKAVLVQITKDRPLTRPTAFEQSGVWLVDLKSDRRLFRKICDEAASGYRAGRTRRDKKIRSHRHQCRQSAIGPGTRKAGELWKSRRSGPGGKVRVVGFPVRWIRAIHTGTSQHAERCPSDEARPRNGRLIFLGLPGSMVHLASAEVPFCHHFL